MQNVLLQKVKLQKSPSQTTRPIWLKSQLPYRVQVKKKKLLKMQVIYTQNALNKTVSRVIAWLLNTN